MQQIPNVLHGRPFTVAQAKSAGVSERMLAGARFERIFRGVYRTSGTTPDFACHLQAAFLILPPSVVVSHVTGLRLLGYECGPLLPLHFSTNAPTHLAADGIVIHRRQSLLHATDTRGYRTLGAMRTFVDVATLVSDRELLRIGDWMLGQQLVTATKLRSYVSDSHLDGVQRARRVARQIRVGSASPRETDVRWELQRSGLPEPELNADIYDDKGTWIARGDLVFRAWKTLVEYDGLQHERDARQRQWDHLRREQLEAAGWRVIVITAEDFRRPHLVSTRVRQALRSRGFTG